MTPEPSEIPALPLQAVTTTDILWALWSHGVTLDQAVLLPADTLTHLGRAYLVDLG